MPIGHSLWDVQKIGSLHQREHQDNRRSKQGNPSCKTIPAVGQVYKAQHEEYDKEGPSPLEPRAQLIVDGILGRACDYLVCRSSRRWEREKDERGGKVDDQSCGSEESR